MEETNDRPKWLLELENRKRKPRLAHEAGAGAPCMICAVACPGLDLHFWRKICKNCKCSRDDHDFEDDDYPQFDLLFGPSKKFKKKPIVLHVSNEKQHEAESAFEWVPPDTSAELATDYMKALPKEKLPIKGSAGAALRRQLLQKQLPLHDIDHKACDELTDQEKKQFEKYLEDIKRYVGQGKVTKILGARPFDWSLMTPANATDMQRFSPQHKPSSHVQLRTPSSFTAKTAYPKRHYETKQQDSEKYSLLSSCGNSETVRSEPIKGGSQSAYSQSRGSSGMEKEVNPEFSPLNRSDVAARQGYKDILKQPGTSIAESILADALLPPSQINAADIIGSTLDEKRLTFIREKLADKYGAQENQLVHSPRGLARELDLNDLLRRNKNVAALQGFEREHNNSAAERETIKSNSQIAQSVPLNSTLTSNFAVQDASTNSPSKLAFSGSSEDPSISKYKHNEPSIEQIQAKLMSSTVPSNVLHSENSQFPPNVENRSKLSNPVPSNILHSKVSQFPTSVDTVPGQLGNFNILHSDVQKAADLESKPADHSQLPIPDDRSNPSSAAKLSSSTVPCNVIHSESLHNQIFPHDAVGSVVQQTQNLPNVEHLRGAIEELTMENARQRCHKCEEEIRVGDVVVITEKAKNATWHPGCFVCDVCNELLVDLVYFHYKSKLYCGRDLASLLGIPRCFACDELIFVREYTVAEGQNYHVKHFCCWDCDVPLAGQKYITESDRPLCLPCYQKTYAKTCNTCKTVIAADQQGVSAKDLNFHANETCFRCYACNKNLLNSRMAIKEEMLFCSKECIAKTLRPQT